MFKKAVEFFIPSLPDTSEEYCRRLRLVAYAIFITALFSIFYAVVSLVAGSLLGAFANFIASFTFVLLLFFLRGRTNVILIANLFGLIGIINIAGCIYLDNGLHSPVMPWLATTPIVILLLAGKRSGYFWALVAILIVGTYSLMDYHGYTFPKTFFTASTFFFFACHMGIVLIIFFIAVVFENVRIRAFNAVSHKNDKLQAALSELKATQAQLIQSEKMASLGQLTAGIAHEIQNPLNFVNNFAEINIELLAELTDAASKGDIAEVITIANDLKDNEQKIIHHGKRADSIVKGMLQHSRASSGKKELIDINALVDECVRLSYHGLRAKDKFFNASIKAELDDTIGKVYIAAQDIARVLLNLCNNAFYAVNEKKQQLNDGFEPTVTVHTSKSNASICISVKDNGNGIPQNIIDKIFQPFFTTKPSGQGTGLGLSLSYDIIKAHNGQIDVNSKEGEGTEFKIWLPV